MDNYAIREASQNGKLDIVKYLHSKGADVTARYNESLIWASEEGHLEVVNTTT